LDEGLRNYSEHLVELEHVVSESEELGSVVVLGDFNAHLSLMGQNVQGVLLQELMDRICDISSGCCS
jgi:endonuclease/exonuclease/phosphatase (EEP) superfamily protein YafD